MAFATFLVWRLRTGACGVGACGFWRYRMPPGSFQESNERDLSVFLSIVIKSRQFAFSLLLKYNTTDLNNKRRLNVGTGLAICNKVNEADKRLSPLQVTLEWTDFVVIEENGWL